jgi:hypothetical protein
MHAEDYSEDGPSTDVQYFSDYGDLTVHDAMLSDTPRMQFYLNVLKDPKTGIAGSIVVDVGAGTGVLSAWALRLGHAAHVIAIEASGLSDSILPTTLRRASDGSSSLPEGSGFTVVHDKVEDFVGRGVDDFLLAHPELEKLLCSGRRIDFIVSEWMGFYLVHECMLPSVILARDFFAEVNARYGGQFPLMIPSHATLLVSPISVAPLYHEAEARFRGDYDNPLRLGGVDLSHVGTALVDQRLSAPNPIITTLPEACVLSPLPLVPRGPLSPTKSDDDPCGSFELDVITKEEAMNIVQTCSIDFTSAKILAAKSAADRIAAANDPRSSMNSTAVNVDGFAIWFCVSYGAEHVLRTGPFDAPTHWKQTVVMLPLEARQSGALRLDRLINEKVCMRVVVAISCTDPERRQYTIDVSIEDANT